MKQKLRSMSIAFFEEPNVEQETYERSQRLLKEGFHNFIIMGGDGTFHQAVNAVLHSDTPLADVSFLFLPCGTGNDWRRTVGAPDDALTAIELLQSGSPTLLDLGIAEFENVRGQKQRVAFINIAGMAYDAYVTDRTNRWSGKGKSGKWAYLWMMFKLLWSYKKGRLWGTIDDVQFEYPKALSLCVGCGRFNGNGMMQLPMAHPADGWLDVAIIGDIGRLEVVLQTPKLYAGTHIHHSKVSLYRAQQIVVYSEPQSLLECEGEVYEPRGPVRFSILPKAWKAILPSKALETFSS